MLVRWTRKALDHLEDAVEYIAADNPVTASGFAQKMNQIGVGPDEPIDMINKDAKNNREKWLGASILDVQSAP